MGILAAFAAVFGIILISLFWEWVRGHKAERLRIAKNNKFVVCTTRAVSLGAPPLPGADYVFIPEYSVTGYDEPKPAIGVRFDGVVHGPVVMYAAMNKSNGSISESAIKYAATRAYESFLKNSSVGSSRLMEFLTDGNVIGERREWVED